MNDKEQKTLEPKQGAIARCSLGLLGMITSEEPDVNGFWHGVQLQSKALNERTIEPGHSWASKAPKVLAESFNDLVTNSFSYDITMLGGMAYVELHSKFATLIVPYKFLEQIVRDVDEAKQTE
jgi:hypothetical protein